MGGRDKGLVEFRDRPMIGHTIELVRPHVDSLIISCNRNEPRYQALADKTVVDPLDNFQGPLAGILAGLKVCETELLLVLPCDTPLLSNEILERLLTAARAKPDHITVLAESGGLHPLHAVIPANLCADLEQWLSGGQRAVQRWMRNHPFQLVDISEMSEQLYNLNTQQELTDRE